jgi:hypothetical protein
MYGFQLGREATANALGWAWERWARLQNVESKVSYLYRVGQTSTRRRQTPITFEREEGSETGGLSLEIGRDRLCRRGIEGTRDLHCSIEGTKGALGRLDDGSAHDRSAHIYGQEFVEGLLGHTVP